MSKKELKYLLLIAIIFIAACVETDIYLPAFPDMMVWFSATESSIQNLLTWNFVGICISGPFYGPISDAIGRKKPLVIALGFFLLGSVITTFANNLPWMLFGRILQGIGSGGCFTLGTAIIFDAFDKKRALFALNQLNLSIPLIMALAPGLGGFLNHQFGFRANFTVITFLVALSFVICLLYFEETLEKDKRTSLKLSVVCKDFKRAFSSTAFWQLTFVMSLLFGGYIAFLSGTSVLFVLEFGMSKTIFPFVQAAILGGWVLGSLTLNKAMNKFKAKKVKKMGIIFSSIGGISLFFIALILPRDPYLVTLFMTLYAFGANWIVGLYFPEGMEILPDIKGITASLMTSARLLIASMIVGLASAIYNSTIYPLACIIFTTVILFLPILLLYEKNRKEPLSSDSGEVTMIH